MNKSEERRKVVTASYSFFKSAEQVTTTWITQYADRSILGFWETAYPPLP